MDQSMPGELRTGAASSNSPSEHHQQTNNMSDDEADIALDAFTHDQLDAATLYRPPTPHYLNNDQGEKAARHTTPPNEALKQSELESDLHSSLIQACEVADKLKESQSQCERLQSQILELQKNLHDAHDFIFCLQPRWQRITESEATTELNSLCNGVEEWVETKLGDALDKKSLVRNSFATQQAENFLSLIPTPGREAFAYLETDQYNITAAIMRFLSNEIFDKEFYCPIEDGATSFLNTIETSMRNLEPQRDLIALRTWHSETFTAIAHRPDFSNRRQKLSDGLASALAGMLLIFQPPCNKHRFLSSIQSAIIEPALSLAHKLHLSIDRYTIRWTDVNKMPLEHRSSVLADYSQLECVNLLQQGKMLKFPAVAQGSEAWGHITHLFDISPGLVLEVVKGKLYADPKLLKPQKILAAVTKENQGRFQLPKPSSGEELTLLGWLEKEVCLRRTRRWIRQYKWLGLE